MAQAAGVAAAGVGKVVVVVAADKIVQRLEILVRVVAAAP